VIKSAAKNASKNVFVIKTAAKIAKIAQIAAKTAKKNVNAAISSKTPKYAGAALWQLLLSAIYLNYFLVFV